MRRNVVNRTLDTPAKGNYPHSTKIIRSTLPVLSDKPQVHLR